MRLTLAIITAALLLSVAQLADAHALKKDAVWSGTVKVEGQMVVERGVTLRILPGTTVQFLPGTLDEEGLSTSGMLVKGTLIADGGQGKRITFTSGAARPRPGDWGEIKLFASAGSSVSGCDFKYGGWGLHIHETDLIISDCTFTKNSYGGVRMKGGQVEITGCLMDGMEIGIRYWKAMPSIHHNTITNNDTGIFCRQECEGSNISFNNIYGNSEYNIKLGDVQKEDIDVSRNWWGTTDLDAIRKKVFDKGRDEYIGRVLLEPVLTDKLEKP